MFSQPAFQPMFSTKVPDEKKEIILTMHFPRGHGKFESFCNHLAKITCMNYHVGHWDYIELANGGFYIVPSIKTNYVIDVPFGRGFSGEVSSDAFGIICCMYTFRFLAEEDKRFSYHCIWLTEFYRRHEEFEKIWWAVE